MEDMEMLSAFTAILRVPNLNKPEHLLAVVEESEIFGKDDLFYFANKIKGIR